MKTKRILVLAVAVCAVLAGAANARAQATRTWVSGVGDDANPCSRTAPCKTFAGAISKTAAGGEISVLDPGGFGVVTITKSITISGDGTLAGILSASTNGVIVNAAAGDVVVLRNLSINGSGTGVNGVRFLAGDRLVVEKCTIAGVTTHGIDVAHNGTGVGALAVSDTSFTNIGGDAVSLAATAGSPRAVLSKVTVSGAAGGVNVGTGAAAVVDSVFAGVTGEALAASGAGVRVDVERCTVQGGGTGVAALVANSRFSVSDCDIFKNATGIMVAPGAVGETFANNRVRGNATNVDGTLTEVAPR